MTFFGVFNLGLLILISSKYGVTNLSCDRIEYQRIDCRLSQSEYLGFVETVKDKPIDQLTIELNSGEIYKFPAVKNQKCVREIADRFQEFLGLASRSN